MIDTTPTESNLSGLDKKAFQKNINNQQTDLYILKNAQGMEVAVTNYGCALLSIMVPDKNGKYANVVLGHDSIEHVINSPEPFLSTTIGRYGNRIANGKFNWAYNHLYDLYYQAGVPLEKQRVASPFISEARESLNLYRAIDPDMWGRMINRVNGINFTAIYSTTTAVGYRQKITLPEGYTWASYMQFLLGTLPENIRQNYLSKLKVSIKFWREKGGCLAESTIEKLRRAGVPITVGEKSNYRTNKRPVRMEYLDDIELSEFKELPTYKRFCLCILKNDHICKYMGFSASKVEQERREQIMKKYYKLFCNERVSKPGI